MFWNECYDRTQSLCDVQTRLFNCCTKAAFYSLPVLVFKTTAIYASGKVNYLASYGIFLVVITGIFSLYKTRQDGAEIKNATNEP